MKTLIGACAIVCLAVAQPAVASCAMPFPDEKTAFRDALETTPIIFVGTAKQNGSTVDVEVKDVWRGGPLPAEIEVKGGLGGPGAPGAPVVSSSIDRNFVRDTTYLFFLSGGPPYEDNACSSTRTWGPELEAFKPIAQGGEVRVADRGSAIHPAWIVGAALLVLASAGLLVVQRRTRDAETTTL